MSASRLTVTRAIAEITLCDAQVPLRRRMGAVMGTANGTLFIALDEARYVTGVLLLVTGGLVS